MKWVYLLLPRSLALLVLLLVQNPVVHRFSQIDFIHRHAVIVHYWRPVSSRYFGHDIGLKISPP